MPSLRASTCVLGVVGLALALLPTAAAQPVGTLITPPRAIAPFTLPAAPALPAGCIAPTREKCADGAWYTTDVCAKDPAKAKPMQSYCTWLFQKAWVETPGAMSPTIMPKSAPSSVNAIIGPGRRIDHSKPVDAQRLNKPAWKRRYPGRVRGNQPTRPAASPTSLDWSPRTAKGGGGSFATMSAPPVLAVQPQLRRDLVAFRHQPLAAVTNPALKVKAASIAAMLAAKPGFVPTPGAGVTSCDEYGYKRWGEWENYVFAARKLGTNYRQMFALATDPSSPFFINKNPLLQTGTNVPIPKVLSLRGGKGHPLALPANAFIAQYPVWLNIPEVTGTGLKAIITPAQKAQILALEDKAWAGTPTSPRRPRTISARTDTTPLGLHREMKALFDRKYDPLDAELSDIAKRTGEYQDLLQTRTALIAEKICTIPGDPCFKCRPMPGSGARSLPAGIQKLKEKVTGMTVINPAELKGMLRGSVSARLNALSALSELGPAVRELDVGALPSAQGPGGGLKQKGAPQLMQLKPAVVSPRGQATSAEQASCEAKLVAKGPALDAAIHDASVQLTKWLVNELAFGDRGCLADPGGELGNMCDWSYALFAEQVGRVFESDVEADVTMCRAELTEAAQVAGLPVAGAFNAVLKTAPNQKAVFPCTQRRDFTASAPDVRRFLELHGSQIGRLCEAERQNVSIMEQQQGIAGQLTGMQWSPGDGRIFDRESDNLTLGDKAVLGAYFGYDAGWDMKKLATKDNNPMWACRFEGAAASNVKAGIYFFGEDLPLFTLAGAGTAKPGSTVTMSATYFDIDTFSTKTAASATNKPVASGTVYSVPLADPPINLGGVEYGFYAWIGPVPIHIVFGANATAGIDYKFQGTGGDNCADLRKPSGFALESEVDPWVSADAYADGSVDAVVASAGIRLELNLLTLNLPIGVRVASEGSGYTFKNGAHVGIDMLSGRLLGYAEVGVAPADVSYEAEIFGWDGFHTNIPIFGLDKTVSADTVRIAMAGYVDSATATCKCGPTFCCSNLTCADCPAAELRTIDGHGYVCTFTHANYAAMLTHAKTTMTQQCQQFVK